MATPRPFHVVVWGSTGFTGKLVCEHIAKDYKGQVKWAMAGRNPQKLESIRADLASQYGEDAVKDVPIIIGTLDDASSLDAIASQTSVIINTAGTPFALNGTPVVDAAVRNKTHYVDITGEVPWVKSLIDKHHDTAAHNNTRIVNCCGYDSIPSDLGTYFMVQHFKKEYGHPPKSVITAVAEGSGGVSGGTVYTGMYQATQKESSKPENSGVYALIPRGAQPGSDKDLWGTRYCTPLQKYLAPFIMQVCNSRIVERSNYLLDYGGPSFSYTEATLAKGWWGAKVVAAATLGIGAAISQSWFHPVLRKFAPAPGQGPSREAMMEKGFFKHALVGESQDGSTVVIGEMGDPKRDPGYWGTSRMVLEAGLCLALQQGALDGDEGLVHGGVLTPASAMGSHLIERLERAGQYYTIKRVVKGGGGK